tara:strand:+ start:3560 stop:4813 length:1254 start_codon:yes stop_codon:yes gene_type:complete
MSNYLIETDKNYPFDDIRLHTPQPIQGGSYLAKISLNDNPIIFQTPKCTTKRGIHKTEKKIYCDLLFTPDNNIFIEWLNDIESKVQELIYAKRDLWFVESDLSLEDIEYNWIDTVKNYKKHYLLRTYVPRIHKTISVQVFDDEQNKLNLDDISVEDSLIGIIELHSLKFSASSFHLEFSLRQCMIIKEKPIFNQCLIKINNSKALENIEDKTIPDNKIKIEKSKKDDDESDDDESDDDEEDDKNEEGENENNQEKITIQKNEIKETPVIKLVDQEIKEQLQKPTVEDNDNSDDVEKVEKDLTKEEIKEEVIDDINKKTLEKSEDNNDTLEKSDKKELKELDEIALNIPDNAESINLRNANDVYLDIYREARKKAKQAKMEAVQQYLMAKRIKQTYLLNEIDLSDDSDDEDFLLFSEK